jgi:hypothetical protein
MTIRSALGEGNLSNKPGWTAHMNRLTWSIGLDVSLEAVIKGVGNVLVAVIGEAAAAL